MKTMSVSLTYEVGGVNIGAVVHQLLQHVHVTKPRSPQQRRHSNLHQSTLTTLHHVTNDVTVTQAISIQASSQICAFYLVAGSLTVV